MLFVYANQKKVVEVGDWMTYPLSSCQTDAKWKAVMLNSQWPGVADYRQMVTHRY